jgi:hypothetical protein
VDAHHINADPDPAFHFNADPDPDPAFRFNADPYPNPAFHFNANPDPAPFKREVILRLLVYRLYKAPILSLPASIMSGHGHPRHTI